MQEREKRETREKQTFLIRGKLICYTAFLPTSMHISIHTPDTLPLVPGNLSVIVLGGGLQESPFRIRRDYLLHEDELLYMCIYF